MTALTIVRNALEEVLRVRRGTSGRLILDVSDEKKIRDALVESEKEKNSSERQYDELFQEAVRAARESGWGILQTHDDLIAALQNMAIPRLE